MAEIRSTRAVDITTANEAVLRFIEGTFGGVLTAIEERQYGEPQIVLRRVISAKPSQDQSDQNRWVVDARQVTYSWPGTNADEAWRFTCVGRILFEIYAAILGGTTITKRDIYYRDPDLFKKQETVDRYIDDIAHTCQVTRKDLNVTASPKGLFVGARANSSEIEVVPDRVEPLEASQWIGVRWLLVVEKEATFKALVESRFHQAHPAGRGIVVTAKGYPDLSTRRFVRYILDHTHIPAFGLFDADPDGLDIFRCYCIGSKRLAQEMRYNLPELQWIGLSLQHVFRTMAIDFICPLTARDRSKAESMLKASEWQFEFNHTGNLFEFRNMLQQMLMLSRKAEIQVLGYLCGGMAGWLNSEMKACAEIRGATL